MISAWWLLLVIPPSMLFGAILLGIYAICDYSRHEPIEGE